MSSTHERTEQFGQSVRCDERVSARAKENLSATAARAATSGVVSLRKKVGGKARGSRDENVLLCAREKDGHDKGLGHQRDGSCSGDKLGENRLRWFRQERDRRYIGELRMKLAGMRPGGRAWKEI